MGSSAAVSRCWSWGAHDRWPTDRAVQRLLLDDGNELDGVLGRGQPLLADHAYRNRVLDLGLITPHFGRDEHGSGVVSCLEKSGHVGRGEVPHPGGLGFLADISTVDPEPVGPPPAALTSLAGQCDQLHPPAPYRSSIDRAPWTSTDC